MDRYALIFDDGRPVAIQDRLTTWRFTADELDTLCDLLNDGSDELGALTQAFNAERADLERQLDVLETKLEDIINEHEDTIAALYDQIEQLENQLDDMQPQTAQA